MHFTLIDRVIELADNSIVAEKNVSAAEEYLQDHFPTFPVLPGVLMIEAMVQAARTLIAHRDPSAIRWVLGEVRGLKYGNFVSPGMTLRVEITISKHLDDGSIRFKGVGRVVTPGAAPELDVPASISGQFTMRPIRLGQTPTLGRTHTNKD